MRPPLLVAACLLSPVVFFCCCPVAALSPRKPGRTAFGRGGSAAAAAVALQQQPVLCPAVRGPYDRSEGPPSWRQASAGLAFAQTKPGSWALRFQPQATRSPLPMGRRGPSCSSACRGAPRTAHQVKAGPTGAPETEAMLQAADFETWGPHLPVDSLPGTSIQQQPAREQGGPPRAAGTIDVHFGRPQGSASGGPREAAWLEGPLGAPREGAAGWTHLQLPLETFLFLAVDSESDAVRFLREGGPHLLRGAHFAPGEGAPGGGALGSDVYELKLAHAAFTEAAAAAVQRRAPAQSGAPKGPRGFAALQKEIDAFFAALYPRVDEGPPQQRQQEQQQQQQEQGSLLHKAAEAWEEFRGALFSPEEIPPFSRIPVVAAKGGAPLWDVQRAAGTRGPPGAASSSRKLLLRLPQLALHEALLRPPSSASDEPAAAAAASAAAAAAAAGGRGHLLLRWAILNSMVRYRELLDPQAMGLTAEPHANSGEGQGVQDPAYIIGVSAAAHRRRLRLLQTLKELVEAESKQGRQGGGLRSRKWGAPLWLLPVGPAVRAWLEASPLASGSGGAPVAPVDALSPSLSQRRLLWSWLGGGAWASRLGHLSSLYYALLRSGAAANAAEAVALLEGLLLSLSEGPPKSLEAMEEELRRQGGPSWGPPSQTDSASAEGLLALPAFMEGLVLTGVDAAANATVPLMTQLNQQAQTLAAQLGLPSVHGETQEDSSRSSRSSGGTLSRAQLLEKRKDFLLLVNAVERRLLMAAAAALEGSLVGGTGFHARRQAPESEGALPADEEEAAVRTFVEAQVYVRDLCHSLRQTLRLPEAGGAGGALPEAARQQDSPSSPLPIQNQSAPLPFPSFADVLVPAAKGPQEAPHGGPQGGGALSPETGEGSGDLVLPTTHAVAAAAARLFAFFQVSCFGRRLPGSLRLRLSRELHAATAASCRFNRDPMDGSLHAEWIIHIHQDVQHLPLLAASLLSSMFAVYRDAVLRPRAILPPGVPPVEGGGEETAAEIENDSSSSCCSAVSLWQAIRAAAEKNNWPFYVGLQGGEELLQLALAASIAPQRGGPCDPAQGLGAPTPLLESLTGRGPSSLTLLSAEGPLNTAGDAVPLAAPGSVSAALTLAAAERHLLLQAAQDEAERDRLRRALEACTAERYSGSPLQSPFLWWLAKEGVGPRRGLALLNALVARRMRLPDSEVAGRVMAVSKPETAGSPLAVPSPVIEGPLASVAADWRRGALRVLPLMHALWGGDRSAAAGGAAAGAVAVVQELSAGAPPPRGGAPPARGSQPEALDSWSTKVAEKLGRDAAGAAFLLRWLEAHTRGEQHASDCMHSASRGVDLRGLVSGGPQGKQGAGAPVASEALFREGLKYLLDLHLLEQQQQHAQRLLTVQHVLHNGDTPEALAETVSQLAASLQPAGTADPAVPLQAELLRGTGAAAAGKEEETARAAAAEAALREASARGGRRQLDDGPERLALAEALYTLLNVRCFSRALPPKVGIVFADPNTGAAAGGTLQRASGPPACLAAHSLNAADFRQPPAIYIHPGVRDVFLLAHLLLQQMLQLAGRVYRPFTTLGVDTPEELQQHVTASRLAPLAEQYASQLASTPLLPPAADGLQRLQTLARPELPQPGDDTSGFMSLSRFFEASAALPAALKEAGSLSSEAAAAQQQLLASASAAATKAASHAKGEAAAGQQQQQQQRGAHALELLAAEAAQTVSAASPDPTELSPAAFLDSLEFVQMEAAKQHAIKGTRGLPVAVSAPGEEEEEASLQEEALTEQQSRGAHTPQRRDWRELLKPEESIRLVKNALLSKEGVAGTSLIGDLVESGSASLERGIEILAEAVSPPPA
ncbi:hypothetical protein Efla_002373 [Eimeria flavescens]